ncbi:MAG: hypothetical protein QW812_01315, partial [Thermoplasmataceae archaeon]
KILSAMGWLQNQGDVQEAMKLIREGGVKRQDVVRFYTSLGVSVRNRGIFLENMEDIVRELSEIFVGSRTPARVIETAIPLAGIGRFDEVKSRLRKIETDLISAGIKKSLELLEVNEKTRRRIR